MNWIHKYANFLPTDDSEEEYLLEMADLLDDKTFVKNADPEKGIRLLTGSVRSYAWNGETENWAEIEQKNKDAYILMLEFYADRLEAGDNAHRPERPAVSLLSQAVSPTEAGKIASSKTVRAIAYDMKEIFGFIRIEWLAELMSAATGNKYTRDRIRKRIGDMK